MGTAGPFPAKVSDSGLRLIAPLYLLEGLRMSGAIPPLPRISAWRL